MSVPAELRITDAEIAEVRRGPICERCNGCGGYLGSSLGFICCEDCGGDGYWTLDTCLPPGASARIGAVLFARLPHLRHAVWPPVPLRVGRGSVFASVLGMIGAVS